MGYIFACAERVLSIVIRIAPHTLKAHPHSPPAAAWAATMTPACRAGGRAAQAMFQVPGPTTPGVCTAARYLSVNVRGSPGWVCIHTVAAWQAWKYSSSVECAGTSILVVTPAGDLETTPGVVAAALIVPDGVLGGAFGPWAEQAAVASVSAVTVPAVRVANGRRHIRSIYATLAAMMQRTRICECRRP
jgi:hypothetical protein